MIWLSLSRKVVCVEVGVEEVADTLARPAVLFPHAHLETQHERCLNRVGAALWCMAGDVVR
jgi:hypothetical protein